MSNLHVPEAQVDSLVDAIVQACRPQSSERALVRQAFLIANAAVVADIQAEGRKFRQHGHTWWDVRLMLDPREHADAVIDQVKQGLDYGLAAGFLEAHPDTQHCVRILGEH